MPEEKTVHDWYPFHWDGYQWQVTRPTDKLYIYYRNIEPDTLYALIHSRNRTELEAACEDLKPCLAIDLSTWRGIESHSRLSWVLSFNLSVDKTDVTGVDITELVNMLARAANERELEDDVWDGDDTDEEEEE